MALTTGQCATLACFWEATVPKPGNVHRGTDFEDLRYTDFLTAAVAISPAMQQASQRPLGETILDAVRATTYLVPTNVNLGIILLLAPMATVPREITLSQGIGHVLKSLSTSDSAQVYEAIRIARPGGLGSVEEMDVAGPPPNQLMDAMRAAAERDLVARQYANGFHDVLDHAMSWLLEANETGNSLTWSVVLLHLRLMAEYPDSLIARKCGLSTAKDAQRRAMRVIDAGKPGDEDFDREIADFDFWLRTDGHRRNPGTTADLIAATLFAAFRDGLIPTPWL